jgi:hypothetical protein
MADGIRVFCRVRPLNTSEAASDLAVSVSDDGHQIKLVGVDATSRESLAPGVATPVRAGSIGNSSPATPLGKATRQSSMGLGTPGFGSPQIGSTNAPTSFNFDRVWPSTASQFEVFQGAGLPMVKDVMEGYDFATACQKFLWVLDGSAPSN